MRSLQVTYSPGENHPREKLRGAWSRGTRVESSTSAGAEEPGRWVRVGLRVCQRDRRAGDRCRRMRVPWVAHLDGRHGFWVVGNDFPSTLGIPERPQVFPSAPGCSRAPPGVPERLWGGPNRPHRTVTVCVWKRQRVSVTFSNWRLHGHRVLAQKSPQILATISLRRL